MADFDVEQLRAMMAQYDAQQNADAKQETPAADAAQTAPVEQAADAQTVETTQDIPVETPTPATQQDKDANAYAAMRVQNKTQSDLLKKIADGMGFTYANEDDMYAKLADDAISKLAERQGIPKEILTRMEALEKDANAYRTQQAASRIQAQGAQLMNEFGLDNKQLVDFATSLGNVDLGTVDLRKEYIARNMDTIIAKRVEAAVQAALAKDSVANTNSTAPIQQGASGNAGKTEVNSVDALRTLLKNI